MFNRGRAAISSAMEWDPDLDSLESRADCERVRTHREETLKADPIDEGNLNSPKEDTVPEMKLLRAKIKRAVIDLNNKVFRRDAIIYLYGRECKIDCEILGASHEYFLAEVEKHMAGGRFKIARHRPQRWE